jgi:hypothetical protein
MQKNSTIYIKTVSNKPTTSEQLEKKEFASETKIQNQFSDCVGTSFYS